MLMSDIVRTLDFHPDDPVSRQVRAALQKFHQTTSLKVNLPLMELQARDKRQEGKEEAKENEPPGQEESHQGQPPSEPDPEEIAEIIISEGDESDNTIEEPQGSSTPRSRPA